MSRKYFGTDGIRGLVGQAPINAEFVMRLGWAAGKVLAREGRRKVVIGKDTRISGYMFESALQAGLSSAGVNIKLLGPMPTPAIAYLTRTLHCDAGIVISASHNPYYDNGIKFFSGDGTKLPDEVELAIEAELENTMTTVDSGELGKAVRVIDAGGRYIEFCKSTVPISFSLKGLKIVIDCAHGATYHVAPSVFTELGADVYAIGVTPDGLNINEGCGSTKPTLLQEEVLKRKADLGIAFDGDGDRVIMVDHKGEVLDGDELLYIIAQSRMTRGELKGGVVGTLMSNFGLEEALAQNDVPFVRAQVGDRYVIEQLKATGWSLGGESSGHLICLDRTTTGDGVVASLQVLEAVMDSGKSLYELKSGMRKYPQVMVNVKIAKRQDVMANEAIRKAVEDAEQKLAGKGRVLLRASGTEPLIRVMVEGSNPVKVDALANELAEVVRKSLT
ncbi:MAG: phosphoglucosamine mutase [Gammaproteobacteria bacterium]|nr:phosphoglucosamine mutase [Gammaproteobacteria bacterium]